MGDLFLQKLQSWYRSSPLDEARAQAQYIQESKDYDYLRDLLMNRQVTKRREGRLGLQLDFIQQMLVDSEEASIPYIFMDDRSLFGSHPTLAIDPLNTIYFRRIYDHAPLKFYLFDVFLGFAVPSKIPDDFELRWGIERDMEFQCRKSKLLFQSTFRFFPALGEEDMTPFLLDKNKPLRGQYTLLEMPKLTDPIYALYVKLLPGHS